MSSSVGDKHTTEDIPPVEETSKEEKKKVEKQKEEEEKEVQGAAGGKEEMFPQLDADLNEVVEIISLCFMCKEQGVTKLMITKIPFFREVIVSSFDCEHCGYQNSDLNCAKEISPKGVEISVAINEIADLSRVVVKSDFAHLEVPQLDLEIPACSQKGDVTTIEGILSRVVEGLKQDQDRRKEEEPEIYEQIEDYVKKFDDCFAVKSPFTLKIRDASGNSAVGNRPGALSIDADSNVTSKSFKRNKLDNVALGLDLEESDSAENPEAEGEEGATLEDEVLHLPTDCSECRAPCFTKMKVTKIPYFKEVIIMATDCEKCGHRTNEVKSGTGIEPMGKRIMLNVKSKADFSRDVLKPETCSVEIPEIDLLAGGGAIVGKFTTIEGLLMDIKKQLSDANPFIGGDSVEPGLKSKIDKVCVKIQELLDGEQEFTLILDDPAGNCYVQNTYAPEEDPELLIDEYERSFEQNEELGLNDMNVG